MVLSDSSRPDRYLAGSLQLEELRQIAAWLGFETHAAPPAKQEQQGRQAFGRVVAWKPWTFDKRIQGMPAERASSCNCPWPPVAADRPLPSI